MSPPKPPDEVAWYLVDTAALPPSAVEFDEEAHLADRCGLVGDLRLDDPEPVRRKFGFQEFRFQDAVEEPAFQDDDLPPGAGLGTVLAEPGSYGLMLHGRAFFAVPDAVWSYKLARYRVLKMRLSYRERAIHTVVQPPQSS